LYGSVIKLQEILLDISMSTSDASVVDLIDPTDTSETIVSDPSSELSGSAWIGGAACPMVLPE
jgi:hypothetical protein